MLLFQCFCWVDSNWHCLESGVTFSMRAMKLSRNSVLLLDNSRSLQYSLRKKKKEDWLNLPDAWHPQANHAASQQWRHARGVVLGYSDGELNAKFRHDSSVTMKRIQCNTLPHRQANIQNKHSWTRCGVMTTKCDSTQGYLGAMNICPSDSKLFGSSDSKSATERGKIIQEGG